MDHTIEFLTNAASRPADAEAITEVSEDVRAELGAAGLSVGVFLTMLPQILSLIRLVTGEGATVQQVVAAVLDLIRALKPAG